MAETRIAKQNKEKERLNDALKVVQSQDKEKITKLQELERIRAEVRAEMND